MSITEAKKYLRTRFAEYGLTQERVAADILNTDPATLSRYMTGRTKWPHWAIQMLIEHFDIPKEAVYAVFIEPFVSK